MITKTTFLKGIMNKSVDERILPQGEYIDALNIRAGSTEDTEVGAVENTKGNELIFELEYNGSPLVNGKCIGAYEDGANETIYWFVTSSEVDMIVSYNTNTKAEIYHVVSETVLNFSEKHLVNSINKVDDLLYFTDNHNPPRKINVKPSGNRYPRPSGGVDGITEDDLSVIVKPPLSPPSISNIYVSKRGNYLEDKFITFAYRWRYLDGEYSALSPFSNPAFEPQSFGISVVNQNLGMRNLINLANVGFNTGDKRVKEIQLCFKRSDSTNLYVIDNYKKQELDLPNNTTHTTLFDNSKIYTLLPAEELFRLYDNVPRYAQAQTIMGNRLMYGNYVDGYNMDMYEAGQGLNIDYDVEIVSEDVFDYSVSSLLSNGSYDIDPANTGYAVTNSIAEFNFSDFLHEDDKKFLKGSIVNISFTVVHDSYTTTGTAPTDYQSPFDISISFELSRDYDGAGAFMDSEDLANAIGLNTTIEPIADADDGNTLTDQFNASLSTSALPTGYSKAGTGSTDIGQAFSYGNYNSSENLQITINAAKYTHATDPDIYEYFRIAVATLTIKNPGGFESLHSNRNYALGLVYNDEYGRQSTVFTDEDNSIFVDSFYMDQQNKAKITINSPAPYWASNYRIAIKPTYGGYDTIYAPIAFENNGYVYMLLEGENARKVQDGDVLIVKVDSNGPTKKLIETTVLEVKAQESNFLIPDDTGTEIQQPAGIYMKLRNTNFDVDTDTEDVVWQATKRKFTSGYFTGVEKYSGIRWRGAGYSLLADETPNGTTPYTNVDIPVGSKVRFVMEFGFLGQGCVHVIDKTYIAERDYNNAYAMFIGQDIDFADAAYRLNEALNTNAPCFPVIKQSRTLYTFDSSSVGTSAKSILTAPGIVQEDGDSEANYIDFIQDTATDAIYLRTFSGVATDNQRNQRGLTTTLVGKSQVFITKSNGVYTFETKADDFDNEIYYLSNEVLPITEDATTGLKYHGGTTQDQNSSQSAISTLNFFDCYCFGNGVESYKIEDKLAGDTILIGQQTSAVSEQDYKEAHRFASITYSGVYNAETNLNKLNQFNLALANYKDLEKSFGQIGILHARETDLLVLQEDKISYVLQGKNLLSDSVGGGTITSIPEVLGTQIARQEENGISLDPSSFAHYDNNVFFTDAKRGDVLMLIGGSYKSDQLGKISEFGMRSYFRDTFIDDFNTLKLGAYDPYMDEYVLSFNAETSSPTTFPPPPDERYDVECDSSLSRTDLVTSDTYEVTFEPVIGTVDIDYTIDDGQEAVMTVLWDGSTVINSIVSGTGTESFSKTKTYPNTAIVNIACEGSNVEPCNSGMDVVFVVDYTASMGDEIDTVKSQIDSIVDTIVEKSGGDYRLGLVIFDERAASVPVYNGQNAYDNLPSSQKYTVSIGADNQFITCVEKMSSNNQESFKRALKQIDSGTFSTPYNGLTASVQPFKLIASGVNFITYGLEAGDVIWNHSTGDSAFIVSVDSATQLTLDNDIFTGVAEQWQYGFGLGSGSDNPEPSDIAYSMVAESSKDTVGKVNDNVYQYNFAGAFRDGVNKMIIIYTDNVPGGVSDTYTIEDANEMRRIAGICNAKGIATSVIGLLANPDTFNAYPDTANITGGERVETFDSTAIVDTINNICG